MSPKIFSVHFLFSQISFKIFFSYLSITRVARNLPGAKIAKSRQWIPIKMVWTMPLVWTQLLPFSDLKKKGGQQKNPHTRQGCPKCWCYRCVFCPLDESRVIYCEIHDIARRDTGPLLSLFSLCLDPVHFHFFCHPSACKKWKCRATFFGTYLDLFLVILNEFLEFMLIVYIQYFKFGFWDLWSVYLSLGDIFSWSDWNWLCDDVRKL